MLISFKKMEILFRRCCGIDLDKNKAKRILQIVEKKFNDMVEVAEHNAKRNDRDYLIMEDFPITKGLRLSMDKFLELKEEVDIDPVLQAVKAKTDLGYDDEVRENMPVLAGTIFVIVGHIMKELGLEGGRRPSVETIERAERILDYTL